MCHLLAQNPLTGGISCDLEPSLMTFKRVSLSVAGSFSTLCGIVFASLQLRVDERCLGESLSQ